MLQEIIELQERAVSQLVDKVDKKREITFRAPTGRGKIFMMADSMNRILSKENDIVFFVSTLSNVGLAEQNYSKFVEYSTQGLFKALNPLLIKTVLSVFRQDQHIRFRSCRIFCKARQNNQEAVKRTP